MESLRHPELGYVILRADQCEVFIAYLRELSDDVLASTYRDWKWMAGRSAWPQADWKRDRCYEEIERRVEARQAGGA